MKQQTSFQDLAYYFNYQELRLLHILINQCYQCETEEDVESVFEELKQLIPFEHWAISSIFYNSKKVFFFENLIWFKQLPEFEKFYFENKLYNTDPTCKQFMKQLASGRRPTVQYWKETYKTDADWEFAKKVEKFGVTHGYSHVHQLNKVSVVCLALAGSELCQKDPKVILTMELFVPHIIGMLFYAKIGKLRTLTDHQFLTFQLLRTSMKAQIIADLLGVSDSNIDKACRAIRKKTGHSSRSTMILSGSK